MTKILAFSGSNSSRSVNEQLLTYAVQQLEGHEVEQIKLTDFDIPIYSEDIERTEGIPEDVTRLLNIIQAHDAYIIASPEHNAYPTAFLKNILDWLSRADKKSFGEEAATLILSASPGKGGGARNLEHLKVLLNYAGAEIVGQYSLGSFYEHFKEGEIKDEAFHQGLLEQINQFIKTLN